MKLCRSSGDSKQRSRSNFRQTNGDKGNWRNRSKSRTPTSAKNLHPIASSEDGGELQREFDDICIESIYVGPY